MQPSHSCVDRVYRKVAPFWRRQVIPTHEGLIVTAWSLIALNLQSRGVVPVGHSFSVLLWVPEAVEHLLHKLRGGEEVSVAELSLLDSGSVRQRIVELALLAVDV